MDTQLGINVTGKPFMFDAIKWSEDGILCTGLENNIYIHTPLLVGISSEQEQCQQASTFIDFLQNKTILGKVTVNIR
ncbi:unnamed protein product [Cunninghamella echinulata]